jgi:hypothetical protein
MVGIIFSVIPVQDLTVKSFKTVKDFLKERTYRRSSCQSYLADQHHHINMRN